MLYFDVFVAYPVLEGLCAGREAFCSGSLKLQHNQRSHGACSEPHKAGMCSAHAPGQVVNATLTEQLGPVLCRLKILNCRKHPQYAP